MKTNATYGEIIRFPEGFIRCLLVALSISFHTARMPLKKQLFTYSLRWHAGDLDEAAIAQERRISAFVDNAMRCSRFTRMPAALLLSLCNTPVFRRLLRYGSALLKALLGDRYVWSAIRQRLSFQIRRPFKRALFWLASGRDLDVIDPAHLSFTRTMGRRVVGDTKFLADNTTAVILGVGQSNISNEGDPSALYEPLGEVYNFNFFDGKCYAAKDPLLGASINRSNVLTRVGDLLVERGKYRRVPARADCTWWDICARMGAQWQDVSTARLDARPATREADYGHPYPSPAGRIRGCAKQAGRARMDASSEGDGGGDQGGWSKRANLCRPMYGMPQ